MNNNIKNIIKSVIFLILIGGVYTSLSYFKKIKNVDEKNVSGFYNEPKNSLDMVYIGGSAAFVYYQPLTAYEKYGIASYDFASNTIQPELYKYITKEIMTRQNPKLLVVDARAYQYRDYDQPPTEVAYRNLLTMMPLNKNKIEFIKKYVPTLNDSENKDIYTYIFDLKKYHSDENFNDINESNAMMFNIYENENKGFYFNNLIQKQVKEEYEPTEEESVVLDETNKILYDYLNYLKTLKNTKVLFVVSPYNISGDEKQTFNYLGRVIKENGFDFIDTNEMIELDYNTDLYNYGHVSLFGSDKYTEFISSYINDNYKLPDRRKNKNYESWNKLLPGWHDRHNEAMTTINAIMEGDEYQNEPAKYKIK